MSRQTMVSLCFAYLVYLLTFSSTPCIAHIPAESAHVLANGALSTDQRHLKGGVIMRSNTWQRSDRSDESDWSEELVERGWAEAGQPADPNLPPVNGTIVNVTQNGTETTIYVDKDYSHVASAIGVMLLGMVTFTMTLFYATHFPDSDVQHATWLTLSEAISLFCGVLIFRSFKDVMVLQFNETGGHHDEPPDIKSLIISFVRFFFAFAGIHVFLMKYRHEPLPLFAWGSIGGNFLAFAGVDCFAMLQQFKPFGENPANAFLGMAIAAFMILCMCISAHIVRVWIMTYEDGTIKEHEQNWHDCCKRVENKFSAIVLGLLVSVAVRYAITGDLPAVWGSPHNKSSQDVWILFGVTMGLALPVFALSLTVHALDQVGTGIPAIMRAARVTQLIISMCMGWSFCFWGQWVFWSATDEKGVGMGDKMTARMVDALFMSYLSFMFIIALDWLADHMEMARAGFDAVGNSFILGLGITWQGAFSEAVDSMTYKIQDKHVRTYMDCVMTLLLCFMIIPAWLWYMLPKALEGPVPVEDIMDLLKDMKEEGEGGENAAYAEEVDDNVLEEALEEQAADEVASEVVTAGSPQAQVVAGARGSFCQSCGSKFESETAGFCQNCGAKRGAAPAASPEPAAAATPAPAVVPAAPVVPAAAQQPAEPEDIDWAALAPPTATATTVANATVSSGNGGRTSFAGGKAAEIGGKGGRGSNLGKSQAMPAPHAVSANTQQESQVAPWDQPEYDDQGDDDEVTEDVSF